MRAEIDSIAALWAQSDKSLSEIGEAVGVSRGKIAGAIHRAREAGDKRFGPRPVAPKAPIVAPAIAIVAPPEPARHAPQLLIDLGSRDCRWPVGVAADGRHTFCAQPQVSGPYCGDHSEKVRSPSPVSASAFSRRRI